MTEYAYRAAVRPATGSGRPPSARQPARRTRPGATRPDGSPV